MWFNKKSKEPEKKMTPFGEFEKKNGGWQNYVEVEDPHFEDGEILVLVDDLKGEPNPRIFTFIPYIIANLPDLEQAARKAVSDLTDEHYLVWISGFSDEADFSINYGIERGDDIICVEFKGGKVSYWWSGD